MTPAEVTAMSSEWRNLHIGIDSRIMPEPTRVARAMFLAGLAYARAEAEAQRREAADQRRADFRAAARPVSMPRQAAIAECDHDFWEPKALRQTADA